MQIFKILEKYLSSEDVETTVTTTRSTSSTNNTTTHKGIQEMEADRLTKLKAAVEKAKAAGALSASQIKEIEAFISDRETFTTLMGKIEAAGIHPDIPSRQ